MAHCSQEFLPLVVAHQVGLVPETQNEKLFINFHQTSHRE